MKTPKYQKSKWYKALRKPGYALLAVIYFLLWPFLTVGFHEAWFNSFKDLIPFVAGGIMGFIVLSLIGIPLNPWYPFILLFTLGGAAGVTRMYAKNPKTRNIARLVMIFLVLPTSIACYELTGEFLVQSRYSS